jgi:hypothetical protein
MARLSFKVVKVEEWNTPRSSRPSLAWLDIKLDQLNERLKMMMVIDNCEWRMS